MPKKLRIISGPNKGKLVSEVAAEKKKKAMESGKKVKKIKFKVVGKTATKSQPKKKDAPKPVKRKFIINTTNKTIKPVPEQQKRMKKIKFKIKPKKAKEPNSLGGKLTDLTKAQMNKLSPLELFSKLPTELKSKIDKKTKQIQDQDKGVIESLVNFYGNYQILKSHGSLGMEYMYSTTQSEKGVVERRVRADFFFHTDYKYRVMTTPLFNKYVKEFDSDESYLEKVLSIIEKNSPELLRVINDDEYMDEIYTSAEDYQDYYNSGFNHLGLSMGRDNRDNFERQITPTKMLKAHGNELTEEEHDDIDPEDYPIFDRYTYVEQFNTCYSILKGLRDEYVPKENMKRFNEQLKKAGIKLTK